MTRLGATITVLLATVTFAVGGGAGTAQAQITIPTLLPPAPAPPGASTPPTTAGLVDGLLKPPASSAPTTAAPAVPSAGPGATGTVVPGNAGGEGATPSADAGPFPADLAAKMRSVRRSGPRNSNQLIDALRGLTDLGVPLDEALRVGMGRFPVAGRANFVDDWWFPRFGPGWRLHEGTDLFAERGTPLRSPANGSVRFGEGGLGGISVYVTQSDGTYFYFAHLDHRPPGLRSGQQVVTGDIIGFVGTTGNAAGGSPHLHFEVHPAIRIVTVGKGKKAVTRAVSAPVRPGTVLPAIDPKPLLDLYLQEALAQLPAIVASYQASHPAVVPTLATGSAVPAAVVLASHRLSSGGLIATDAPLVRTPLLGLAFLLIVMVVVLTPVLAPHGRPVPAHARAPGGHPARTRRRRKARKGEAAVPPLPAGAPIAAGAGAAGGGRGHAHVGHGHGAHSIGAHGHGANGHGAHGIGAHGRGAHGIGAHGYGTNGNGTNGNGTNGNGTNGNGHAGNRSYVSGDGAVGDGRLRKFRLRRQAKSVAPGTDPLIGASSGDPS